MVKPKKSLGQHFLRDNDIAQKIVEALSPDGKVLEIGPGTGVLTKMLKERFSNFSVVEIDDESVAYLHKFHPDLHVINQDVLSKKSNELFNEPLKIIGNFPYNITAPLFFKILDFKDSVSEVVCMIQKEPAQRIAAGPGSRTYGILSVFLQAFYNIEYLYTVQPDVFIPPPKVQSAVIRLTRNNVKELDCDARLFKAIVKISFNQRRKMLRKSLRKFLTEEMIAEDFFTKRPEQLSVNEFVMLVNRIQKEGNIEAL